VVQGALLVLVLKSLIFFKKKRKKKIFLECQLKFQRFFFDGEERLFLSCLCSWNAKLVRDSGSILGVKLCGAKH
jgi:hypothetical protein